MATIRQLNGNTPYVVLKPCTSFMDVHNMYRVKDCMFSPNKANIYALTEYLNRFQVGTATGCDTVDPKFPPEYPPIRTGIITPKRLEELVKMYKCNVLGAVFIALLESFNLLSTGTITTASVASIDREFFETVYPIFKGYFDEPRTVKMDLVSYLDGVVCNNTGVYTVIGMEYLPETLIQSLRQISYLKRLYRYAVVTLIPYPPNKVHDNLVHSPETLEELELHAKLFRERRVK